MNISESIEISIGSIRAHKLRSFLTLLGLIIGVMTLILVMTIVQGANSYVEEKVANLGTNVFQVSRTPVAVTDFEEFLRAQRNKLLELDDVQAVREICRDCQAVGAETSTTSIVKAGNEVGEDVNIRGLTANMAEIGNTTIAEGRYISQFEETAATSVCVLGSDVVENLFPYTGAIGKTVRIANDDYLVVGIAERMGTVLGQSQDNFVIIPITAFLKLFGSRRSVTIQVKTADSSQLAAAMDQVRLILRSRRHVSYKNPDDFYIVTSDTFLSLVQYQLGVLLGVHHDLIDRFNRRGHRDHEHHVGVCHRTHQGNRNPQGLGGQTQRYSLAVPDRSAGPVYRRWFNRSAGRLPHCPGRPPADTFSSKPEIVGCGDRLDPFNTNRDLLRNLPGSTGLTPGPH